MSKGVGMKGVTALAYVGLVVSLFGGVGQAIAADRTVIAEDFMATW